LKEPHLSKKLDPLTITAIQDTREQTPLVLGPFKTIKGTLATGDYSVQKLENKIAIERKSLQDLIGCVGHGRERFEKALERLAEFKYKGIVVEGDWSTIELKSYRGSMAPTQILGTMLAWSMGYNVPILMVGDHERAGRFVSRMLYIAANREHRLQLDVK
jgi:DNA excision repair protein ERCC-4